MTKKVLGVDKPHIIKKGGRWYWYLYSQGLREIYLSLKWWYWLDTGTHVTRV